MEIFSQKRSLILVIFFFITHSPISHSEANYKKTFTVVQAEKHCEQSKKNQKNNLWKKLKSVFVKNRFFKKKRDPEKKKFHFGKFGAIILAVGLFFIGGEIFTVGGIICGIGFLMLIIALYQHNKKLANKLVISALVATVIILGLGILIGLSAAS